MAFHPMTNSMWVTLLFFYYHAVSLITLHPMTNREWGILLFSLLPCSLITFHLIQQGVSDLALFFFTMHFIPWPTVCEWHGFYFYYHAVSLHFIPWPTACEWHCFFSLPCSLIAFHPMTNSLWVTLFSFFTMQSHYISSHNQQAVSDNVFFFFTMQSHCISSHDQQQAVSDTASFSLQCSLITFHPMTNRKWVMLFLSPHWCLNKLGFQWWTGSK